METTSLQVLDSLQEFEINRTQEITNQVLNLPPGYLESLDLNTPRNNIGLQDVNPIIVRIPHRTSTFSYNGEPSDTSTASNLELSNVNSNQLNVQSDFNANTRQFYIENLANIENSESETRSILRNSESDPFLAEVRYIIQPKPPKEPAFSMATAICLLGCCFPPFWFLGSLLFFQTKPDSLARGWAVISISLFLGFSFFFIFGVISYGTNPENWDSFIRACFPWL